MGRKCIVKKKVIKGEDTLGFTEIEDVGFLKMFNRIIKGPVVDINIGDIITWKDEHDECRAGKVIKIHRTYVIAKRVSNTLPPHQWKVYKGQIIRIRKNWER
jgi:hypothetical protein